MCRFFLLFLLLIGCQPDSYEAFREQGRAKTRSLIAELKKIRTKDQLVAHESELRAAFGEMRELIDQVGQFRAHHPDLGPPPLTGEDKELSDQLRLEMLRIFRLDGGREILDRCRTSPRINAV